MIRCFGILLLLFVLCAWDSSDFEPPFEIRALLLDQRFDELERLLGETQARFEAGEVSEDRVSALFNSFSTTDPDLEAPLDTWNEANPKSAVAPLARAHYNWRRGWAARGTATRKRTPAARFERMRELFDQAQVDSIVALKRNPKLSLAYRLLISIGNARGAEWVETVMLRGLEEVPRSYSIRSVYLHSITPWWGGSMAEIRNFLKTHVRTAPNQEAMQALYGYPDYVAAKLLKRKGLEEEALSAYERALAYGDQTLYLKGRAGIHRSFKRYREVLADFDRMLEISPHDADTLGGRAYLLYWRIKDKAAAHADWRLSIRLDPLDPDNLYSRAYVFYREKRSDEAMADLEAALVYGESDHRIHGLRGKIQVYSLKQYRPGAQALKRATELKPKNATYWYNYAYALDKLLDCEIVPALRRYLELCEAGADCDGKYTHYAANKIKVLHEHDECLDK
ncbi:MAG: DUF4034 domain-containing protein [Pseudomonadota bacterium]